jgi:hypothetical protein
MQRICNAADWEFWPEASTPAEAPCGRMYDDVDHSTLCPHEPLPPKLSIEELSDLHEKMRADGERPAG